MALLNVRRDEHTGLYKTIVRHYDRCAMCLPGSSAAILGVSMLAEPWGPEGTGGLVGSMTSAGGPALTQEQVKRSMLQSEVLPYIVACKLVLAHHVGQSQFVASFGTTEAGMQCIRSKGSTFQQRYQQVMFCRSDACPSVSVSLPMLLSLPDRGLQGVQP